MPSNKAVDVNVADQQQSIVVDWLTNGKCGLTKKLNKCVMLEIQDYILIKQRICS